MGMRTMASPRTNLYSLQGPQTWGIVRSVHQHESVSVGMHPTRMEGDLEASTEETCTPFKDPISPNLGHCQITTSMQECVCRHVAYKDGGGGKHRGNMQSIQGPQTQRTLGSVDHHKNVYTSACLKLKGQMARERTDNNWGCKVPETSEAAWESNIR